VIHVSGEGQFVTKGVSSLRNGLSSKGWLSLRGDKKVADGGVFDRRSGICSGNRLLFLGGILIWKG